MGVQRFHRPGLSGRAGMFAIVLALIAGCAGDDHPFAPVPDNDDLPFDLGESGLPEARGAVV